jgi:hypothetical protein
LHGGNPSHEDMPALLLAAEKTLRLWESFFVFAEHKAAHKHRAKHDDKAK